MLLFHNPIYYHSGRGNLELFRRIIKPATPGPSTKLHAFQCNMPSQGQLVGYQCCFPASMCTIPVCRRDAQRELHTHADLLLQLILLDLLGAAGLSHFVLGLQHFWELPARRILFWARSAPAKWPPLMRTDNHHFERHRPNAPIVTSIAASHSRMVLHLYLRRPRITTLARHQHAQTCIPSRHSNCASDGLHQRTAQPQVPKTI